jgi:hypothetical protein
MSAKWAGTLTGPRLYGTYLKARTAAADVERCPPGR